MAQYRNVRALKPIKHDGQERVPGTDSEDFVVRLEQALALEAMEAVLVMGDAPAPLRMRRGVVGAYREGSLQWIDNGDGEPWSFGDEGGGYKLEPFSAAGPEDQVLTGNIFSGINAPHEGSTVLLYTVEGKGQVFLPGDTVEVVGKGDITLESDGTFTLEPSGNWNGAFPLVSYQAKKEIDLRWSSLALFITPLNDAPTVRSDYAVTALNQAVTLFPLSNDSDAEGSPVTLVSIGGLPPVVGQSRTVTGGAFTLNANNSVTVTPSLGFEGQILIPYVATDGVNPQANTIRVDVAVEEAYMFSPVTPADPSILPWLYTIANWYGPANSATNPTDVDNGINATPLTYTEAYGLFVGGDTDNGRQAWLFDAPTTMYLAWKRTNDSRLWDIALERLDLYYSRVSIDPSDGAGYLTVNGGAKWDTRYSYCTPALWYETETGDQQYREKALACAKAQYLNPQNAKTYSVDLNFWTERHRGYAIRELLSAYVLTADVSWLNHCTDYVNDTLAMCAATGVPLHTEWQHEQGNNVMMFSTWMANQLVHPMIQYYRITGDERIVPWLARYVDRMAEVGLYTPGGDIPGRIGWYYVFANGAGYSDGGPEADLQHSYDLLGFFKAGRRAKEQLGEDTAIIDQCIADLTLSSNAHFVQYTRGAPESSHLTKYRLAPSRKGNWMFGDIGLQYTDAFWLSVPLPAPIPAPVNTAPPTATGVFNEGATVVIAPGAWTPSSGPNAPTFTFFMQRANAENGPWTTIPGSTTTGGTSANYVLASGDVDKWVRPAVSGANSKSTITAYGSAVLVNAAGAPSLTLDLPETVTAPAQTQLTLTVAASGTSVTYTYRRRANSGAAWAQVQAGPSPNYVIATLVNADNGAQFQAEASNVAGNVFSRVLQLTVTAAVRRVGVTAGGADNGSGAAAYYASLQAALVGEVADLPALDRILHIEQDNFVDTVTVNTNGLAYVTGPNHYILIKPRAGHGHGGAIGQGYRLSTASTYNYAMYMSIPYTRMEGFSVYSTNVAAGASPCIVAPAAAEGVWLRRMIMVGSSTSDFGFAAYSQSARIESSVVIGTMYGVHCANYASGPMQVDHVTCVGQSSRSFYGVGGTEVIARDNYGQATLAAYDLAVAGPNVKSNCASADGTGSAGKTGIPYSTATFTSVTPGSENLVPAAGSALIGAGAYTATSANLAGTAFNSPPNIGAY